MLIVLLQSVLGCSREDQLAKFRAKLLLNESSLPMPNPYLQKHNSTFINIVQETLNNPLLYCVVKYIDSTRAAYYLKDTTTLADDIRDGWIVTHKGNCGACSSLQDLTVYLTTDLTRTVRACGSKYFYSDRKVLDCIKALGFSQPCAEVWLYNALNTKQECGLRCLYSMLVKQPFVVNGHLNKCLECDEDRSGPFFKFASGRTRRNSGVHSEIDRPEDQIFEMEHCYF